MAKKKNDVLKEQLTPASGAETQTSSVEGSSEASEAQTIPKEGSVEAAEGRSVPENKPTETAPVTWPAVVRSPQGLNLRKGPALSYEVLEVLPDGAEVTALDLPMGAEVPGWRLVYTGERAGWVQSRFLRLEG